MTYWAIVRYTSSGTVTRLEWPSLQARQLQLIALGGQVQILEEGHKS